LSIDFETRATVDLRAAGVYPYAQHEDTDLWCMAWAFDDEPVQIWYPAHVHEYIEDLPNEGLQRVFDHIRAGGEVRAWNAEFERIVWHYIMHLRYGFPDLTLEQVVDTAAEASAMALPRSLDQCAKVLKVSQQKDDEGYGLMMRMTRPRSKKGVRPLVWWYDEARIRRLGSYCGQDVNTERAVMPALRRLTPLEREHYLEVCRQNDAGIRVDLELVQAMRRVADEGLEQANAALEELTGGEVEAVTDHQALRQWVNSRGVETTSVAKKAIRDLLESDLAPDVREALTIRKEAGRTSLAKLDAVQKCIAGDGKIHGMLVYHGASTGRETAKLFQPHNLPKGELANEDNVERYIDAMLREAYDELALFYHPITIVSAMIRSVLTAAEGHELIGGDFSGIEARVVNWVAGQDDMLENFRRRDAGDKRFDPYIINAMRYYGVSFEEVTRKMRDTGKFQELGCGFGMGAKTGRVQAKDLYGLILTEEQTQSLITSYRETHPMVKGFWKESNHAAIEAVREPGTVQTFGALRNLRFTKRGAYLYLILPAGRPLCYAQPKLIQQKTPWDTMQDAVQIMAMNPKTRQWGPQRMYGGLWTENLVQAIARDLMAEAKLRVRAAGYPSVLTVHDEVVSQVPQGFGTLTEFESLLTTLPAWAAGLPVAAEAWRGFRYRK
jgi:DNA polymerase bacteriophage-type